MVFQVRATTAAIKASLRTADPVEAKRRQAALASYTETVWQALREDAPLPLTNKQATALAGLLYRAWAEGRERTDSVTLDLTTRQPIPDQWGIEDGSRDLGSGVAAAGGVTINKVYKETQAVTSHARCS